MRKRDEATSAESSGHDHVVIQKIAREHMAYESRLCELSAREYLTDREHQEVRILKKKKLLCKDRIEEIKRRIGSRS